MMRQELMQKWEEGDLITLGHRDLIHYVWIDTKTGNKRICRPSMIEVGTYSRDIREWEILKRQVSSIVYEDTVKELDRKLCGHCASWVKKNTDNLYVNSFHVQNEIQLINLEYPESLLDTWKMGDYSMLHSSGASEYIKSILIKKAKDRLPGRRFFGEAYVAARIKMIDGWYNSFKWLTSKKWLSGIDLKPDFEKPFHEALIKHFGLSNLKNLQQVSRSFFKNNSDELNKKNPVAPDLWIIDKNGNHKFIECKLPGDTIGLHQKAGLMLIKENLKNSSQITVSIANLYPTIK